MSEKVVVTHPVHRAQVRLISEREWGVLRDAVYYMTNNHSDFWEFDDEIELVREAERILGLRMTLVKAEYKE